MITLSDYTAAVSGPLTACLRLPFLCVYEEGEARWKLFCGQ